MLDFKSWLQKEGSEDFLLAKAVTDKVKATMATEREAEAKKRAAEEAKKKPAPGNAGAPRPAGAPGTPTSQPSATPTSSTPAFDPKDPKVKVAIQGAVKDMFSK